MPFRLHWMLVLLTMACSTLRSGPADNREGYVPGAGGVRLFYKLIGSGRDTVVVLHGGPGLNLEGLRPDLMPLARGHVLLYYDQRGSGRSDMPDTLDLTADAMVEDLETVRQAFRLEHLTLLGHSWGGGLAALYAMRYQDRVRRMLLVGSVPPRGKPYFPQYLANQAARHDSVENRRMEVLDSTLEFSPDPSRVCREVIRLFLRGVTAVPENATRIRGDLCVGTPENVRRQNVVLRRVWVSLVPNFPDLEYDWRPQAARLSIPTLIVHGVEDPLPLASAEEWTAVLPEARLVAIPGAGHYPHAEQPERFFLAVEAFLGGRWPRESVRQGAGGAP